MDPNNPKILLIEDDPLVRHVVKTALAENHYEIAEAGSGAEGLEKARSFWPDLVLLDVMMPDLDGYEVCYRLRQSATTANVPVILLTALGNLSEKIRGLQIGADDYITKPFDPRELRTRVEAHLRRSARELSASPLTNLPGSPLIEQILSARIESRAPLAVLYFDLGNFKAYNDEYGWIKGDGVLRMLAREILETVAGVGGQDDFIGHVGGDDFVVISTPAHAEKIAQRVIARFDGEIPGYYSEQARAHGYIEVLDRQGKLFHAPIMSVVIAIMTNEKRELHHPLQVAELAAQVKRSMRLTSGSQYAFDRRRN